MDVLSWNAVSSRAWVCVVQAVPSVPLWIPPVADADTVEQTRFRNICGVFAPGLVPS